MSPSTSTPPASPHPASRSRSPPRSRSRSGTRRPSLADVASTPHDTTSLRAFRDARDLALQMRTDLAVKTKDRTWRLKTYESCFKASHAVDWAKIHIDSSDEKAVAGLNGLVDHGLLTHVVDPAKRFRAGETKTLYFRMVDTVLDAELTDAEFVAPPESRLAASAPPDARQPRRPRLTLVNGEIGSRMNVVRRASVMKGQGVYVETHPRVLHTRLDEADRLLQETVRELHETRGKLELVHQEVLGLVSQQIATFMMIFMMIAHTAWFLVPYGEVSWFGLLGLAGVVALTTRHGFRCISLWSDLDSRTSGPPEALAEADDDDDSDEGNSAERNGVRIAHAYGRKRPTLTKVLSESVRSLRGLPRRSSRALLASRDGKKVYMREAYSLPDAKEWPHKPLFVCVNSTVSPSLRVPDHGLGACPIGVPFAFSSEMFEGTCLIRLKGVTDDPDSDAEYFSGRKRTFQSVVQGRFREPVSVADILTGHEFVRSLRNLPHPFVLRAATNFIRRICPGADIAVHGEQPMVSVPLGGTCQALRGDAPGNEPDIAGRDIEEDCAVLGGAFSKEEVASSRRKRLFSNPEKCKQYEFDTETVYTFEFYQNLFDARTYSLDVGFTKFSCANLLNGQPIQWLAKMRDGRYLWSFQIWHEDLLKEAPGVKDQ